jgi:hypothetical protein
MERIYLLLAYLILITHTLVVLFIVGGFAVIWIGYFREWRFVRNFYFRVAHLLAMGFVAVQTIFGEMCPLTTWEDQLRGRAGVGPQYESSFIGHWLGKILFYEIDDKVLVIVYTMFFALVVWTVFLVKPRNPRKSRGRRMFSPDDAEL